MDERELKGLILEWIKKVDEKDKVQDDIEGLNFGLYESSKGYCMYLIGAKFYDEEDDDWACNEDFRPIDKYLKALPINKEISYAGVIDSVVKIIKNIIKENSYLDLFKVKHITTGFDNGELYIIK
ncbi:hypothetical protein [Clostridium sp. LP20]|uniref:hypothetical protein n=1 Tax=Clostridium sp. LP20 TaxID=3418665 RepID=UPI003EE4C80F